jgi:hypothetical protein
MFITKLCVRRTKHKKYDYSFKTPLPYTNKEVHHSLRLIN